MAEFDPIVQPSNTDIDPRSRPLEAPQNIMPRGVEQNQIMPHGVKEGDRSAEYFGKAREFSLSAEGNRQKSFSDMFAGITSMANFAVGAADAMIKKNIENEVYATSDIQREFYTAELQEKAGKTTAQSLLNANAQMTDEPPEELDALPERLDAMAGASPSGTGRMTHTNYYGRLLALSKDLRARYPGYRQYIDDQFARVTGVNPANAVIGQLTREINSNQSSASSQRNKTLTYITQNAELLGPYASKMYRAAEQGIIGMPEVLDAVRPKLAQKLKHDEEMRAIANFQGTEQARSTMVKQSYQSKVESIAGTAVETLMVNTGTDEKTGLTDFLRRAKQGGFKSDELMKVGTHILNVEIPKITQELNRVGRTALGEGRTYTSVLGQSSRNEINTAAIQPLKDIANALIANDIGIAFDTAIEVQANQRDFTGKMMKNPDIAPSAQMFQFFEKHGGQAAVSGLLQNFLIEGGDQKIQKVYSDYTKAFRAQIETETKKGFTTPNDMLKQLRKDGLAEADLMRRMVEEGTNDLTRADVPDTIKGNLVKAFYSPQNYKFIESLGKDGRDSKGNPVPGTYTQWRIMTREGVVDAMQKIRKVNESFYNDYVNWVQVTQRNLFQREVQALNDIQDDHRFVFGYSAKDNRFFVDKSGLPGIDRRVPNYAGPAAVTQFDNDFKLAQNAVARINMGIKALSDIAKAEGRSPEDVTAYLLQKSKETGIRLDMQTQGLPSKMYKELVNAAVNQKKSKERGEKEAKEEYPSVSEFTPATPQPTMSDFIRNPTGVPQKPADAIKPTGGTQTAPRNKRTSEAPKRSVNVSDQGDIVSMDTLDIPEGMSPSEYIGRLRSEGKL